MPTALREKTKNPSPETENPALIAVASIAGAFGVKGDCLIHSLTDSPASCFKHGPLLDINGDLLLSPQKVKSYKKRLFIVTAQTELPREHWQECKGKLLYLQRQSLPAPDTDEYYICDLVGCALQHEDGRKLGTIQAIHNFGAGDILEISGTASFMLPFNKELIQRADPGQQILLTGCEDCWLPPSLQQNTA